jgi:hypothetical protein
MNQQIDFGGAGLGNKAKYELIDRSNTAAPG